MSECVCARGRKTLARIDRIWGQNRVWRRLHFIDTSMKRTRTYRQIHVHTYACMFIHIQLSVPMEAVTEFRTRKPQAELLMPVELIEKKRLELRKLGVRPTQISPDVRTGPADLQPDRRTVVQTDERIDRQIDTVGQTDELQSPKTTLASSCVSSRIAQGEPKSIEGVEAACLEVSANSSRSSAPVYTLRPPRIQQRQQQ